MAERTTDGAVCEVLLDNYDSISKPDLTAFITAASLLVDDVVSCATEKGITLSAARQELLERWLAAHFYVSGPDPLLRSKKTMDASGEMHFPDSPYYSNAELLDPSGCLTEMKSGKQTAEAFWGGKPPSDQIDYEDRD